MINRKNRTTMKLRKYLAVLAVAAFASLATSCAEAEDEFIHTDSTGRRQWIANLYAVGFLHAQITNYNE